MKIPNLPKDEFVFAPIPTKQPISTKWQKKETVNETNLQGHCKHKLLVEKILKELLRKLK